MKNKTISKSLFMEGVRCPRLFWLRFNRPELASPLDEKTAYLFSTGHTVEKYAHRLFDGGVIIGSGRSGPFSRFLAETEAAMNSTVPYLFEAAFSNDKMLCRTDVLHRWDSEMWNLCEIKMSAKVKPEHFLDVAFQSRCMENSGHRVGKKYLLHVNKEYTRHGEIEPEKLFVAEDLTPEVDAEIIGITAKVDVLLEVAKQVEPPNALIGAKCNLPGRCPFYGNCHDSIPPGSVHELPFGGRIIPILLEQGIHMLTDIPVNFPLSVRQSALVRSAKTGLPVINTTAISQFLRQLEYPLTYLDFETISGPLPPYENSFPWEKIPFQWSAHTQEREGGDLQHHDFLSDNPGDPRKQICDNLIELLHGRGGSILAWNASFEKGVMQRLGMLFPHQAQKINEIIARVVDLIVPFRNGDYADYRFGGSASLKKVLPVLTSLTYDGMAVKQGDEASLLFQKYVDGAMTTAEYEALRPELLAYNELDTKAMASILEVLYRLQ